MYTKFHGQFVPPVDNVIREFFEDWSYKGVFVEAGAGHPLVVNNSYHFHMNGWHTICVEPNPELAEEYRKIGRPVCQVAALDVCGEFDFSIVKRCNGSMDVGSAVVLDERYLAKQRVASISVIKVQAKTLNLILDELGVKAVDVLTIDVEGSETRVLNGFDLARWRPKVIVIENGFLMDECRNVVARFGYKLFRRLAVNDFFVLEA